MHISMADRAAAAAAWPFPFPHHHSIFRGPAALMILLLVLFGVFSVVGWTLTKCRGASIADQPGLRAQSECLPIEVESRMTPDTSSPLYPDRPIRPLPRRRLRERLSPDVADSIQYPPAPENSTSLFYYPPNIREDEYDPAEETRQGRRNTPVEDSEDEELANRRNVVNRRVLSTSRRPHLFPKLDQPKQSNPQPPPSAASSVDGYDSLENSNNKKKRKIPSAGDLAGDRVVVDVTSQGGPLAAKAQADGRRDTPQASPYYGQGGAVAGVQNVPGPGRGRYGRIRNGRSPLRPLTDSTNSWAGRGRPRSGQVPPQSREFFLFSPCSLSFLSFLLFSFFSCWLRGLLGLVWISCHLRSYHTQIHYSDLCSRQLVWTKLRS